MNLSDAHGIVTFKAKSKETIKILVNNFMKTLGNNDSRDYITSLYDVERFPEMYVMKGIIEKNNYFEFVTRFIGQGYDRYSYNIEHSPWWMFQKSNTALSKADAQWLFTSDFTIEYQYVDIERVNKRLVCEEYSVVHQMNHSLTSCKVKQEKSTKYDFTVSNIIKYGEYDFESACGYVFLDADQELDEIWNVDLENAPYDIERDLPAIAKALHYQNEFDMLNDFKEEEETECQIFFADKFFDPLRIIQRTLLNN